MSRPGPPPKPRALKVVQGTLRKDRDNPDAPEPPVEVPPCPHWLSNAAKYEWRRVAPRLEELGLISAVSRAALAGYCESWARWREAELAIAAGGAVLVSPKGYEYPSPWVGIANTAKKEMRAFLQEFGMTPASATRARASRGSRKSNPFEAL